MAIGQVRPTVAAMAAYRPGKGAKQAEAEHGIENAIKLASNENPFPPPASIVAAMQDAAAGVNRYGDHRATLLRERLSERSGVSAERITVGCGSSGLLQQLFLAYCDPGDEAVFPWLSFEAYPVFANTVGATQVRVPLVDDRFDLDAVVAAVTDRTRLVLLATPNNPTGSALSLDDIRSVLERVPPRVLVVIDEAYREFGDADLGDPVTLLDEFDHLVILRTFSKAYGLAATRIGYLFAHRDVVAELDKVLLAFAVNAVAQAGALAALDAVDEIQPMLDLLLTERARVTEALRVSGWDVPDPHANFVWLPLREQTDQVCLDLERLGVVTRPFSESGLRVTIGTREENDRFLAAFAETVTTAGGR